MNKKVRWGIVGCGGIADRRTLPAMMKCEEAELIAVMDMNEGVAKNVCEKYGAKRYYTDAETLISQSDIDAIYIATPVFCHEAQAKLCLKYEKHVLIEKPLAMNHVEAEKIVKAFECKSLLIMAGYMMRYHNLHEKMKQMIEYKKIGQVVGAELQFSCWYPEIKGAWRQDKKKSGGGAIMDLGVHCLDLFQYLTGDKIQDIKSFYGTKTFGYEVEDSGLLLVKSEKNIYGSIAVNFNIPDSASSGRVAIYGTEGSLVAEGTLGQEEKGTLTYTYCPQGAYDAQQSVQKAKAERYDGEYNDLYAKQIRDFDTQIINNQKNYSFAWDAVFVQSCCDKIYNKRI